MEQGGFDLFGLIVSGGMVTPPDRGAVPSGAGNGA